MSFYEKFLLLCNNQGQAPSAVAEAIGSTRASATRWKNGSRPSDATIQKLAAHFHVSFDYFAEDNDAITDISPRDARLISAYHRATPADRAIIDNIVDRYADAVAPAVPMKIIPLFGTAAAAGPGEPDTGLPWEDYEVPQKSSAEFAVRITGDSMEPELHDGQIALCLKCRPRVGELAVMMVNGTMLVKQFITDNYNIYLRSLNRARKDCDYDIMGSGNDTVLCFGIVMTDHKIPLVD